MSTDSGSDEQEPIEELEGRIARISNGILLGFRKIIEIVLSGWNWVGELSGLQKWVVLLIVSGASVWIGPTLSDVSYPIYLYLWGRPIPLHGSVYITGWPFPLSVTIYFVVTALVLSLASNFSNRQRIQHLEEQTE